MRLEATSTATAKDVAMAATGPASTGYDLRTFKGSRATKRMTQAEIRLCMN